MPRAFVSPLPGGSFIPKGQESAAQALAWVGTKKRRLALKGPDRRAGLVRRKTRLFLKILLRGFKRSLISAARPNKSGGSEDEVNEILKKFDLTTKFEQVYVSFAGETSETGRKTGNVLIVLGLQIGSILSRLNC